MAKSRIDVMFQAQREIAKEHPALHSELCQYAIQLGFEYADAHPEFRQDKAASKVPYRSGAATAEVVPANGGNGGNNNPDDGMLG